MVLYQTLSPCILGRSDLRFRGNPPGYYSKCKRLFDMTMNWIRRGAPLLAAGAILALGNGCSPTKPASKEHEHAGHDHDGVDEAKSAQITVFGDRYEVFAEYRAVVAGKPTKFVTHVTDLKTLEPRREGPVRFQLRFNQEPPIEHVEKAPTRAGIYEASLTFPKAGSWGVSLSVPSEDGERVVQFPPIRVFANAHDADHAEIPEPPEGITFLKEQQWRVKTGTETATRRELVEQIRLPAKVTARPGALAHVNPPVAGRLLLPEGKSMPIVGDKVEAGQVLAFIQPSISEAGLRLAEAEAEVIRARLAQEQAEAGFKRVEALAKVQAKSGRELQEAEFALKMAAAKYEAALALQGTYRQASTNDSVRGAEASQPRVELRSPISGIVTAQSGSAVGEYINEEKPLFTVLDASTVFIEARVPEISLERLAATRGASYELPGSMGQFSAITGPGLGRLIFLGIEVDSATHTVPLIYEARNVDYRLRVGQSLNLYVETKRIESGLAVPQAAIVEEGGRPIVFVQVAGETFQKREVKLGIRDGIWVQILSGIEPGERVVTEGAYAVRLASVSNVMPSHGHAH